MWGVVCVGAGRATDPSCFASRQEEDVAAEEEEETGAEVEKADPTHFSDLEPKSMKVG